MNPSRHNISVDVDARYLENQSSPSESRFVFAYTITIRNQGEVPARLLKRRWLITDATGRVEEVRGPGVVGQEPVLEPGHSFEYTSGCPLSTPYGSMRGSYEMLTAGGDRFDANVAPFELRGPYTVH